MTRTFVAASLVLVALLLPTRSLAQGPSDVAIADEVSRTMLGYVQLSIFDHVSAQVEGGIVTLGGHVTMPYKKSDIDQRVARLAGVRGVRNEINVLPTSSMDDDLRYRVARAIYGNPSFWPYARMANPPIHIIVERGRVTLAGVVNSNVERMLARSLATGQGEISVTNELKTDAEIRGE